MGCGDSNPRAGGRGLQALDDTHARPAPARLRELDARLAGARAGGSETGYRADPADTGVPFKTWRGRQPTYDRTVAGLSELLGRQTYAAAWSEGSKLPIDQAVAEVLAT